eukprot:2692399-Prymnesium_polylepis.1
MSVTSVSSVPFTDTHATSLAGHYFLLTIRFAIRPFPRRPGRKRSVYTYTVLDAANTRADARPAAASDLVIAA